MWMLLSLFLATSAALLHMALRNYERKKARGPIVNDPGLAGKIISLEREPQSGFWIRCRSHGNLPLTKSTYDAQCLAEKYVCPICSQIPQKIWRKLEKKKENLTIADAFNNEDLVG